MNRRTTGKVVVIAIVVTMILSIATMVHAEYNASLSLSSSSKLVESGSVVVTTTLQATDVGTGVDTVVAELDYDKSVFEGLTSASMSAGSGWTLSYAESTNRITLTRNAKTTTSEAVLTINFKVKSTINADSTTIKLKDIDIAGLNSEDPDNSVSVKPAAASVTISREKTTQPIVVTGTDTTTAQTQKLPQTGVTATTMISIVAVATIGAVSFVLYKKMAKEVK